MKKRSLGIVRLHLPGTGRSVQGSRRRSTSGTSWSSAESSSTGSGGGSTTSSLRSLEEGEEEEEEEVEEEEGLVELGEIQADGVKIKALNTGRVYFCLDAWIKVCTLQAVLQRTSAGY